MAIYTTSMMCANLLNLQADIEILEQHTDMYHIDIMDGHFVPNLALSIDFIKHMQKIVTKPIDAHLMVTNPNAYIDELIAIGVNYVTLHPSTITHSVFRIINKLKEKQIKVGMAISPSVNLEVLKHYIHLLDKVTIMTVEPGFAGQKMIKEVLPKIAAAKALRDKNNYQYLIEIDGSNNKTTFEAYKKNGADIFVLGSSLFNTNDLEASFLDIKQFIENIKL